MKQYHELLQHILANGIRKEDRTGTGTISVFGYQTRFNLADGFPLVTTKKCHLKSIIHELLWFLKGETNIRYLKANGVSIWDAWVKAGTDEYRDLTVDEIKEKLIKHLKASEFYAVESAEFSGTDKYELSRDEDDASRLVFEYGSGASWTRAYEDIIGHPATELVAGELGPVYGAQWRSWPTHQRIDCEMCNGSGAYNDANIDEGCDPICCPSCDGLGYHDEVVDQIRKVVDTLRNNPDSRRIIVSAWNPALVDDMALPPCHAMFQFYSDNRPWGDVIDELIDADYIDEFENVFRPMRSDIHHEGWIPAQGQSSDYRHPEYYSKAYKYAEERGIRTRRLSCQLYQRSADVGLGVAFNWASYALLTMMVAQVTNHVPGEFVWTGGDVHIYTNHIEPLREQLTREPYPLPKMQIRPEVKEIDDFVYDDFELVGYQAHPHIKMDVSV